MTTFYKQRRFFLLQNFLFMLFLLGTQISWCQSFSSIYRSNQDNDNASFGGSPYNPYFDDYRIIPSLQILNDVPGLTDAFWTPLGLAKELVNEGNSDKAFRLPVYTNIADWRIRADSILTGLSNISTLLMSETGLGIGASPYWILNERAINGEDEADKFYLVAKSELGLKYNVIEDKELIEKEDILQLRVGAGLAMGFSFKDSTNFFTIDLMAVYSSSLLENELTLSNGDEIPDLSFELNALIPLKVFDEDLVLLGVEVFAPINQDVRYGLGLFIPIGLKPKLKKK